MAQLNITLNQEEILQLLLEDRGDAFKSILQASLNKILQAESSEQRKETARMLKTIGQLTLERDFLQDCFRRTGTAIPEFDPDRF